MNARLKKKKASTKKGLIDEWDLTVEQVYHGVHYGLCTLNIFVSPLDEISIVGASGTWNFSSSSTELFDN